MEKITDFIFWFGTDFCINMANLLGITYDEFNMALFLFVMPALIIALLILNVLKTMSHSLRRIRSGG